MKFISVSFPDGSEGLVNIDNIVSIMPDDQVEGYESIIYLDKECNSEVWVKETVSEIVGKMKKSVVEF